QEHDAGDGPVEPVHQADEDVARLVVPQAQIVASQVEQRRVAAHVALREQPRGLVDGQAVVVFVQDAQGHDSGSSSSSSAGPSPAASVMRFTTSVAYAPLGSSKASVSLWRPGYRSSGSSVWVRFAGKNTVGRVPF